MTRNSVIPELGSTIGRRGKTRYPDGRVRYFDVIDEVRVFQGPAKTKAILMQLCKLDTGLSEIRIGYYIIGKKPRVRGRWVWGQYAPFVPARVFQRLLRKAQKRGWLR